MKKSTMIYKFSLSFLLLLVVMTVSAFSQNYAVSVVSSGHVTNPNNAISAPDGLGAEFTNSGVANIILDMGASGMIATGSTVTVTSRRLSANNSTDIYFSTNSGSGWVGPLTINNLTTTWADYMITAPAGGPFQYVKATGNNGVQIDAIGADAPFPVELTSFSAVYKSNVVNLSWKTATEVNNYGFAIERKAGSTWNAIGFVSGHGTVNTPNQYSFTDRNPVILPEVSYRLKQIDRDGKINYSPIENVNMVTKGSIALDQNYPNPFNPTTNISFTLNEKSNVKLSVFDISGKLITTLVSGVFEAGNFIVPFDATLLPSGTYIYKLEAGSFTQTRKMNLMK